MLSIFSRSVKHVGRIGGIALAKIYDKKRRIVKQWNSKCDDGPVQTIARAIRGDKCKLCISCEHGRCYFAFRKFPECFVDKAEFN